MAFTNNRPEFRQGQSYTEELHAKALNEGIPSFVNKGLDLTGTTLTSGVAINSGIPGQWGEEGETHTITANYTGFIILKTVLDGANGLNSIVEDVVRNDTDPRSTSKTRYFTIYELLNGVIVQDFRHSNYIKNISFENVGGSNFVQNINGTKSNSFDASTFAGNRTLVSDYDINYDDTIHAATLLKDVLLDMFNKTQTLVGHDKPFILTFTASDSGTIFAPNFATKLFAYILSKQGVTFAPGSLVTFSLHAGTANGSTDESHVGTNKCTVWNEEKYFEFSFQYNDFDNAKVKDEESKEYPFREINTHYETATAQSTIQFNLSEPILPTDISTLKINCTTNSSGLSSRANVLRLEFRNASNVNTLIPLSDTKSFYVNGVREVLGTGGFLATIYNGTHVTQALFQTSPAGSLYGTSQFGATKAGAESVDSGLGSFQYSTNDNEPIEKIVLVKQVSGITDWYASIELVMRDGKRIDITSSPVFLDQPLVTPKVGDNMEETSVLKEVIDNV